MNAPGLPTLAATAVTGLPPIDTAFEPASVRNGSPAVQKAYASALDFESMLVQQLSRSLAETSGLGGEGMSEEGEGGSDPASTQLSSLLPQTLTEGVMSHGGLGLAQQMMGSLAPPASATAAPGPVTVGGGSPANAPTGSGGAWAQIDPTGGVAA
jgi:Rod binding domain-containing protein